MLKREKLYKNFVHDCRSSENNSTEKLVRVLEPTTKRILFIGSLPQQTLTKNIKKPSKKNNNNNKNNKKTEKKQTSLYKEEKVNKLKEK